MPSPVQNELAVLPIKTLRISWQPTPGAEFYRVLENADGVSGFQQIGDDLAASVQSYDHSVALYARTNAAYMVQACDAFMCSDSEVQTVSGFLTNAVGYFKPSFSAFNNFGTEVALSADGDPTRPSPTFARESGAVHVFVRSADGWTEQAYIKASDAKVGARFGLGLALSDDGNTMAVYATKKVYLFERSNGQWEETTTIDVFGHVSLSGDGNTLATRNSENGSIILFERGDGAWNAEVYLTGGPVDYDLLGFGATACLNRDGSRVAVSYYKWLDGVGEASMVFMFERTNDIFQQTAVLKASNPDINDGFGLALSLSADGNTLVVGATGEDSFATGVNGYQLDNTSSNSGAAYVFIDNNGSWEQQAYLKAGNNGLADSFGGALSISANGDTLVVGAKNEDSSALGVNGDGTDNSQDRPGAAYVFTRSGGIWQQQAYLKASNTNGFAWFGASVSVSADGRSIAVGAKLEYGGETGVGGDQTDLSVPNTGAVYLY